jgi:arginase
MPVSVIMGEAAGEMRALLQHPIAPEQFRYVWANVADAGDRSFQQARGLKWLREDECFSGPVHIHFDLDVLNPQEFPFLAYPEANGMAISTAIALMRRLASENDIVGLTLTEFAPANGHDATIGSNVVADLCRAIVIEPRAVG